MGSHDPNLRILDYHYESVRDTTKSRQRHYESLTQTLRNQLQLLILLLATEIVQLSDMVRRRIEGEWRDVSSHMAKEATKEAAAKEAAKLSLINSNK